MSTEHWWDGADREQRGTGSKTCFSATASTTNPTWTSHGQSVPHPAPCNAGDELPEPWKMKERRREIFMCVIQLNPFTWHKYKPYEE